MSLDEIWQAVAADNLEARKFLARYEQDLSVARAEQAATLVEPPQPGADTKPMVAVEFEIRKPAALIAELTENPRQRADLFTRLAAVRPQQFRAPLVESLGELAIEMEREGDLDAAVAQFDHAIEHARQLAGTDREMAVARCLYERSRLALRLGRADEALRGLREAAALAGADARLAVGCARMRQMVLKVSSENALREGLQAEAVSYLTELADVLRTLIEHDPDERAYLAMTLNNLGSLRFEDDHAIGLAMIAESVAMRRNLVTTDPSTYLPGLAAALNNLGFMSQRAHQLDTAWSSLVEAVAIRHELAAADLTTWGGPLLRSLNNLVIVLSDLEPIPIDDLLGVTAEASELAVRLAADDPSSQADVVMSLLQFVKARILVGRQLSEAEAAVDTLIANDITRASSDLLRHAIALKQLLAAR